MSAIETLSWEGGLPGYLRLIDQTRLPEDEVFLELRSAEQTYAAILRLAVRGAPAIGLAGAYGLVLGLQDLEGQDLDDFLLETERVVEYLTSCRPTAVNLATCLDRMHALAKERGAQGADPHAILRALLDEARAMHVEDRDACQAMGEAGAQLLEDGQEVLTHCNAGALATGGIGTALAPIYVAKSQGKRIRVHADETRPLLQGARLTAFELSRAGIEVVVNVDGAAPSLLRSGKISAVFVGADRVAANGDVANKIGTLGVAIAAKECGVPFYVVAPTSTVDLETPEGTQIPIEERAADEIATWHDRRVMPPSGVGVFNPAFDVTPAKYLTALITERGVLESPDTDRLRSHLSAG